MFRLGILCGNIMTLIATMPGGGMRGSAPQLNDFARPCPPITFNFDQLVSCYCPFYVIAHRSKFSNARSVIFTKGYFRVLKRMQMYKKPPDRLCCLSGTLADICSITTNVEGVVNKTFLIGAPKLLLLLACPIHTLFTFRCGCHTHPAWLPSCSLTTGFLT